jgi:sugar/nucleoside kinase (ribokinase family)
VAERQAVHATAGSPRVLVFGDVIDDIIVTPSGDIRSDTDTPARIVRTAGGSAANTAAWLAGAGCHVDFVGRVHVTDLDRHRALLVEARVSPHLLGEPDLPTGAIVVIVSPDGSRTMLTQRGANSALTPRDIGVERLARAGHLHFTGYSVFRHARTADFPELIRRAHGAGVSVSVDPGSAGFISDFGGERFLEAIEGVDILVPNLDEGRALTGLHDSDDVLEALVERFALVALTLGRDGVALGTHEGDRLSAPSRATDAVDTTGAGDAFCAAFLAALLREPRRDHEVLSRALSRGLDAAALAVSGVGARPGPTA